MGEAGHGWWSVNNFRPPFEQQQQHHPSLLLPSSSTTAAAAPSSALHSFSSLLLENHYPLPTTSASPYSWLDSSSSQGLGQQDSWSQLILGGLVSPEDRHKEGRMLFPTTVGSEAGRSGGSYIYSTTASHGSSTSDEIQLPWSSVQQQHKALQQKGTSSPRRSSSMTPTTSLGSNMFEFSNNSSSSPRECIGTVSGSALKKARTQEPSQTQSTTVKVRKEKLGDRITALHQLVSPFGKTDTASVLLEAIGYIRFLHNQIEALSSPYVGGSSGGGGGGFNQQQQQQHEASVQGESRHNIFPEDPGQLSHDTTAMRKRERPEQPEGSCDDEEKKDLRSRGLCLVPVSCTLDVGMDVIADRADYWGAAPAFGMGFGR